MNILKKLFNKKQNHTQVFDISLPRMQATFEKMKHEAKWDMNQKMFWGYYFLDHDVQKLEKFGKKLEKSGYRIVEIRNTGKDNLFILHAEEHVFHSAESLFKQCHKLAELATENDIEIFDGWDVEKINMDKGLVE